MTETIGFCQETRPEGCGFVLLGATGDLAARKILPALFGLCEKKLAPANFYMLLAARTGLDRASLEERVRKSLAATGLSPSKESLAAFLGRLEYLRTDYTPASFGRLGERLAAYKVPAALWREVPWEMRLTGTRCMRCGQPQYPPQRVCVNCKAKDEMEPYSFVDVPAAVFSFTFDVELVCSGEEALRPAGTAMEPPGAAAGWDVENHRPAAERSRSGSVPSAGGGHG